MRVTLFVPIAVAARDVERWLIIRGGAYYGCGKSGQPLEEETMAVCDHHRR